MPKAKQPSRKSKSAWRKNIDIDAVEKSLERQRVAERLGEEPIHAGTNASSIFVEDRQGEGDGVGSSLISRQQQRNKGLKSLQILNNGSGAMGLMSRARKGAGSKAGSKPMMVGGDGRAQVDSSSGGGGGLTPEQRAIRAGMSKKEIERLRRVAGRDVKGAFGVIVEEDEGANTKRGLEAVIKPGSYDVWATPAKKRAAGSSKETGLIKGKGKRSADDEEDEGMEGQGEIQLPSSYLHATKKGKSRALAMPKPGQSYNPSAEDHEELLKRAVDVAHREEERKQQEMEWKRAWDAGAKEARGKGKDDIEDLLGLKVGQGDLAALGSGDEDEKDHESAMSDDEETKVKSNDVKRKTKQQRAKAKKLKEEQRARLALKAARKSQSDLQSLRSLKKQLSTIEQEKAEAAEVKRLAKQQGLDRRVGVYKMPREDDDVQLGEDLAEGLRLLKPEGNLLKDRVHTFYKRGIVEPKKRDVIGKNKRGSMRGRKEYESHAYKRFS